MTGRSIVAEATPRRSFPAGGAASRIGVLLVALITIVSWRTTVDGATASRTQTGDDGRRYEAAGAHFNVRYEGAADEAAARRIVELLEQAYWDVGRTLGLYPSDKTTVILYTRQEFSAVTGSPDWAGAIYDGRIRIPAAGADRHVEDLRRTLVHEYVHAVVASVAGARAPAWLNEGLATALEPDGLTWTAHVLAATDRRLPLESLNASFGHLGTADVPLAYAQSAHAVKRLLDLRGAPALTTLLQALRGGLAFDAAFQQHLYMRTEDFFRLVARD